MKDIIVNLALIVLSNLCFSQIIFQKIFGGTNDDYGYSIQSTYDGGYIIAASTKSFGAGNEDVCLIKTDNQGNFIWLSTYGGVNKDFPRAIIQTLDSGYVVLGSTYSFGAGGEDIYLLRMNKFGILQWSKTYGGNNEERGFSIQQTSDGGFIIGGTTMSFGQGLRDAYVIKTNDLGNISWTKVLGGYSGDVCINIQQTNDGGYIFTGAEYSFGAGFSDYYLVKLNNLGNMEWSKAIGGFNEEHSRIVKQTSDSGFVIIGHTNTWGVGNWDILIVKTNQTGDFLWAKTYGGSNEEFLGNIIITDNDGLIIAGSTLSFGSGSRDLFIIKTDFDGNILWSYTYGSVNSESLPLGPDNAIQQTIDGGFVFIGTSNSFGFGGDDIYLIKTDSLGNSGCNELTFNPTVINITPQFTNASTSVSSGGISNPASTIVNTYTISDSSLCAPNLVANFQYSNVCEGSVTIFTDSSFITNGNIISWQWDFGDGDTSILQNPTHLYTDTGTYTVTLIITTDIGNTDTISKTIYIFPSPNAYIDTSICEGETYFAGGQYQTTAGTYYDTLTTINNCDSIIITNLQVTEQPDVFLGNDTTLCQGESLLLDATTNNVTYLWQDGSTNPTFFATDEGTYWVVVTDSNNCSNSDTIDLSISTFPVVDLGNDTLICEGDSLILDAGYQNVVYNWSTGDTTQTITVDTSGLYYVEISNVCGVANDSVQIELITLPAINLGSDTALCEGDSLLLDVTIDSAIYLWQDGSTNPTFNVTSQGVYWVEVTVFGCSKIDNIIVNYISLPSVNLGQDTTLCWGESLLLDRCN